MRLLALSLTALLLVGCAGRRPDEASFVDLTLSDPVNANVNLSQWIAATEYRRNTTLPLLVTVTETPGPTGISSRVLRLHVQDPVQSSEYGLVAGGTTYVELVETSGTTSRTWRSDGGKLTLVQNDAKGSEFHLTNVELNAFAGSATGRFRVNGPVAIRF